MADSPNTQNVTVQRKPDRRRTDAERIKDLEEARAAFVAALTVYVRAKAHLNKLLAEEKQ